MLAPATIRSLVLLVALGAAGAAWAADEIHWTITGPTSVTFDWRGEVRESSISYGTAAGRLTTTVEGAHPSPLPDSSPGPFWEARLVGLQADTLYYYRIAAGPEHTFRTPPPPGTADFWIAAEGDVGSTRSFPAVGPTQARLAQDHPQIPGDDRPRFVLVLGDLTYGEDQGRADVDQHFNDVMVWSQDAAYMPVWGNHDWSTDPTSPDQLSNYEGRFDLPNSQTSPGASVAIGNGPGEDWYWFDYGNVRFIAYPEDYPGAWVDWGTRADPVMAAAQGDPAISFIVTFGHHPAYSTGHHAGHPTLAKITDRLRRKYGKYVLNLNAHSHDYERTCSIKLVSGAPVCTTPPDQGLVHVTAAGGGADVAPLLPGQPWTVYRTQHLAHLKLRVARHEIEGFVVCGPAVPDKDDGSCTEGALIDHWTIPPRVLDHAGPATTASHSPAPNANGWNNTEVTVTLTATDGGGSGALAASDEGSGGPVAAVAESGSGVKEIVFSLDGAQGGGGLVSGSTASVPISAEGMTTLTYFARDVAGNAENPQAVTVRIDKTPPGIVALGSPAANANGWNNTEVTVTFVASDDLSGVQTVTVPLTVAGEGAGQVVSGTAVDQAGNAASVSVTLNIDRTPPLIAGLPPAGCTLWPPNHRLVEVATVTARDALSGLDGTLALTWASSEPENGVGDGDTAPDAVISGGTVRLRAEREGRGPGRTYTLTGTASDRAGNAWRETATCVVPHDKRR